MSFDPTKVARRDRRPLLVAAVFVLLMVGGLAYRPALHSQVCPSILVASSSEKASLMESLAGEYSRKHPNAWPGCGDVVRIEEVASGDGERELSQGWPDESTRPDVWAPAASTWVKLLRAQIAGTARGSELPDDDPPHIAASPLIVAMPDQMARALGWPAVQPSWGDLLQLAASPNGWAARGHPEWGAFRLGKTDPSKSTSGIHTLMAEYYAATGKTSDLTVADLQQQGTSQYLRAVEASVSHYAPTAGDFLTNVAGSGGDLSYISAIAVEEQEVFNYNEGLYNPPYHIPPHNALDAVYPAGGTLIADHPFVVLKAPWVSEAKVKIADGFKKWLMDSAQARFAAAGFRSYDDTAGPELAGDRGVIPGQPSQTLSTPAPNVLAAIVGSWQNFRKAARIALVLDINSPAQRAAVIAGVKNLGDSDEVGVWSSSPKRLSPVSLLQNSRSQVMAAIASAPLTHGGTALYSSIDQAYGDLSEAPDPNRINAIVVIAAGPDGGTPPRLKVLERELLTPKTVPIRVYTVALGTADRSALFGIELASGGYASRLSDPAAAIRVCLANF